MAGGNPEGDGEIWVMDADGGNPTQLTFNSVHDEGAAWSPDGTMLAYSSGADNDHVDINVMTASGVHLRRLTDYVGRDESPDWQPIPAPDTDRRCGDVGDDGPLDVRAAGRGLRCCKARRLARRWCAAAPGAAPRLRRRDGGLRRHRARRPVPSGAITPGKGHGKLVAFLYQPAA